MTDKILVPLFSKPVFKTTIDVSDVDLSSIVWAQNYQNWISDTQEVLANDQFSSLSARIAECLREYFYGIMSASQDVEIYITESWFNKTEKGQSHHRHWHPNSVLSGVVYLQSEVAGGDIRFITSQYDTLEYNINEPNLYNSKSWSLTPEPGTIVIFPSNVEHLVDPYFGDTPRISLSFNTFVKGQINSNALTRLKI